MNMTTEIKNKEDSLRALMSRILREPLDPLNKSINASMETLLETKDKLDDIESSISVNGNHVENMSKSLKKALNDIKDEVLPDHAQSIQRQLKTLSEANSKKLQDSIEAQKQSIDILKTTHDTVLSEILANQELNQRAIAELTQQCTASNQTLAAGLQKAIQLIENAIRTQHRALETSHQTLLEQFSIAANGRSAIQQSLTHLANQHIAELTQHCTASNQTLATGLQKATHLIENAISTQQGAVETSHQTLLEHFGSAANDRNAIQQSLVHLATQHQVSGNSLVSLNDSSSAIYARLADVEQTSTNAMEGYQAALKRMLTEQNAALTAHIAAAQSKLKTLTITTGMFFVSMLGYVGYDVWSKFN